MRKLILTAMIIAGVNTLHAQSSWELGSATTNYDLTGAANVDGIGLTRSVKSTSYISTTTTPTYLPCPSDGVVHVVGNSANNNNFVLDQTGSGSLTFNASNSTSSGARFSMYGLNSASPLTKLSFTFSFREGIADKDEVWVLYLGQLGANDSEDPYFQKTTFLPTSDNPTNLINAFSWRVAADKTITFQYRAAVDNAYRTISSTLFEQGSTYNVEVICNNTDVGQEFNLPGETDPITINSGRTMLVVNGSIVQIDNRANAAEDNQIYSSSVMAVNTAINAFSIMGYKGSGGAASEPDGAITLSNISWNYVLPSVLPVSFISFVGKNTNEGVELTWETASEENNSYFEIYKSQDGQTFSRIGTVPGNLTTNQKNSYSFIDKYPFTGANYYQLKQVDGDRKVTTYDKIVFIANNFADEIFNVYVSANQQVNINVSSDKDEVVAVRLTDVAGRVIYNGNASLTDGENHIQLPSALLAPGVYVVSVVYESGQIKTAKIIL